MKKSDNILAYLDFSIIILIQYEIVKKFSHTLHLSIKAEKN